MMRSTATTVLPEIEPLDGVYVPAEDSRLLIDTFARLGPPPPAEVLDLCTGSGVVGIAAAMRGHHVDAVDGDRRAVVAARRNALLNGTNLWVQQSDLFGSVERMRYDVILSNPPYVPTPPRGHFDRFGWCDGGPDGRVVIDRICEGAAEHLVPGGMLLMVHSSLADIEQSVAMLIDSGLASDVVAERTVPLGPISMERLEYLRANRFAGPDDEDEIVAVIRAIKPD